MPKPKSQWKLVNDFPVTKYRCGACAGEHVRLRHDLAIQDHCGRPTGKVHKSGEIWIIVRGTTDDSPVLWLHEPNGTSHTWDDDQSFWNSFERV